MPVSEERIRAVLGIYEDRPAAAALIEDLAAELREARAEGDRRVAAVLAAFQDVVDAARATVQHARNPGGQTVGPTPRLPLSMALQIVRDLDRLGSWAKAWDAAQEQLAAKSAEVDRLRDRLGRLAESAAGNAVADRTGTTHRLYGEWAEAILRDEP